MQIVINGETVSFEHFEKKFPKESKILAPLTSVELVIEMDQGVMKVSHGEVGPISIAVKQTLDKHKKTFYKRSPYQENLARALGVKTDTDKDLRVLDATAGLMSDTLMMVALGLRNISICERNPILQALIVNSMANFEELSALHFRGQNSACLDENFDVIYFDPMYQAVNKKSASKKEMVFMRQLIGADEDASSVATILKQKCHRLVIKRSQKAPPLIAGASFTVEGKSTHYDIYFNN